MVVVTMGEIEYDYGVQCVIPKASKGKALG